MTAAENLPDLPGLNEGDPVVLDFETPDKTGQRPWQAVKIDGHIVYVRQPKDAFLVSVAGQLTGPNVSDTDQLVAADKVLKKVFDEESRTHVQARLDDDDDDFDFDELGEVVHKLQELWGKDRGGSARGSAGSSRARTKRSTARRR